jgi:hypothetical protein
MKPASEDLNSDRFCLGRPNRVEVLALKCGDGIAECGLDDV